MEKKLAPLIKVFGKLKVGQIIIILKDHANEGFISDLLAMKDDITQATYALQEDAKEKKDEKSLTGAIKEDEENIKFQKYYNALVKQAQSFENLDNNNLCLLWDSEIEAVTNNTNEESVIERLGMCKNYEHTARMNGFWSSITLGGLYERIFQWYTIRKKLMLELGMSTSKPSSKLIPVSNSSLVV